jgi:hypothetical protein
VASPLGGSNEQGLVLSALAHSEPESKSISEYFLPDVDLQRIRFYLKRPCYVSHEMYKNLCGVHIHNRWT